MTHLLLKLVMLIDGERSEVFIVLRVAVVVVVLSDNVFGHSRTLLSMQLFDLPCVLLLMPFLLAANMFRACFKAYISTIFSHGHGRSWSVGPEMSAANFNVRVFPGVPSNS